jgi:eukaryotic-like serine/threonine-protein kinase
MSANSGVFVGRTHELAELASCIEFSCKGSGQTFVLVSGESGIGKSRISNEASQLAASAGMIVMRAECWEGSGAPVYWPFIQVIRNALDVSALITRLKLTAGGNEVIQLSPALAKITPEPIDLLPSHDSETSAANTERQCFRLFDYVSICIRNRRVVCKA